MRFLWAAYRMGLWHDILDAELSREGFHDKLIDILSLGDFDWIIHAPQDGGVRPVGIVIAQGMRDGRRIEPHVDWFPWATPRNKLEGIAAFLLNLSKRFKIVVYAHERDRNFWERLKAYGLVRHGCKVWDHFDLGKHAFLYYTAGP